jgi:diacylglycerol kinase
MINPKSFYFAFKGIADLFSGRHKNALVHLLAVAVVSSAGFYFSLNYLEWCIIIICFVLVISLEAVNSAIEYLTDLASPDFHPLAGKAKDMAAAAVLIAATASVIIAFLIFYSKLIK